MSFQEYLLEKLKRIVKSVKKGDFLKMQRTKEVREAVEHCLKLGCTEDDVKKAIQDAYFEDWPS